MNKDELLLLMQNVNGYCYNAMSIPAGMKERAKELCNNFNNINPRTHTNELDILNQLFGECTFKTFIQPPFFCDYGFNIHMHGKAIFNHNCIILDTSTVEIGENFFAGPNTEIICAGHAINALQRANSVCTSKPVSIGHDVWLGANVVVNPGVKIGDNVIIGSGSIVTHDIPNDVIAAGNPCKIIRKITEEDIIPEDLIYC